jgi:hypothetical protein
MEGGLQKDGGRWWKVAGEWRSDRGIGTTMTSHVNTENMTYVNISKINNSSIGFIKSL